MTPTASNDLNRRVEQLERTVFIGNGTQSLITKLAGIEQKLDTVIDMMDQQKQALADHDEKDFSEHRSLQSDHNKIKSEVDVLLTAYNKEEQKSFATMVGNHKGVWMIIGIFIAAAMNGAIHYFTG